MEPISPIFFDCNSGCALAKSMQLSKNSSFKDGSPWLATTVKARATINRSSSRPAVVNSGGQNAPR
jgi:hypothetical protein